MCKFIPLKTHSTYSGELWKLKDDYKAGDLGWDPLGLYPPAEAPDAERLRVEIQNRVILTTASQNHLVVRMSRTGTQ